MNVSIMIRINELLEDNISSKKEASQKANGHMQKLTSDRSVKCFVLLMSTFFVIYSLLMFFCFILNDNTIKWVFAIYMAMLFILLIILRIIDHRRNNCNPNESYKKIIKARIMKYPTMNKRLVSLSILKCDINIELSKQTFLPLFIDCYLFAIIPFVIGLLLTDGEIINKVILVGIALIVLISMIVSCAVKIGHCAISGNRKRKLIILAHDVDLMIENMLIQEQENIKNTKE